MGFYKASPPIIHKRNQLKDVLPLTTPYTINVDVSSLCNMKCEFCFHSNNDKDVKYSNMSWDLYIKIINDIIQFPDKPRELMLTCFGEPLVNPHIVDMISMANEKNIYWRHSWKIF